MVFSSIPAYLDASYWQQQQSHQIIGRSSANPLPSPPPQHPGPPPPPPPQPNGGGGAGSVCPGSMAERARLANIPMPEAALKCPRCESTNTKFCYFNNYCLTQPRHLCKTCRRYWTRGGALRKVPVGGGCRKGKRSKPSCSKSPSSSDRQTNPSTTSTLSTSIGAANILGLTPQLRPQRIMSPLGQFNDSFTSKMGLNYSGITAPTVGTNKMNFHCGSNLHGGGMTSLLSSESVCIEPWRLQRVQQFPFLGGLDTSSSACMYQFHGGESGFIFGEASQQVRPKLSSSMVTQLESVKMEDNTDQQNLSRRLIGGGMAGDDQWNAPTAWTEVSNFSFSSTSNPL